MKEIPSGAMMKMIYRRRDAVGILRRTMFDPLLIRLPMRTLTLFALAALSVLPASGGGPDLSKYPLRIQVLAATAHSWTPQDPFANGGGGPQVEGVEMPMMMGSGPPLAVYSTPVYYGEGW